jgi:hypothetical protein
MSEIGFIILRYVHDSRTNQYWINCYDSIRKFYKENKILIIDSGSNYSFITNNELYNTTIIKGEFPGRGELLPYYYYLHNKLFDIAVILHDSTFINKYVDFNVNTYKHIWDFEHTWDQPEDEIRIMKGAYNDQDLLNFHSNQKLWKGCFGSMTIIKHDYLVKVNNKYDISKLLDYILVRYNRMSFERIIACLLEITGTKEPTLIGDLHSNQEYGTPYEQINNINKDLPIIKFFSSR